MDSTEDQIILNQMGSESTNLKSRFKTNNPGLRALLSIKKLSATMENDYTQLLQIESDLSALNKKSLQLIELYASPEAVAKWQEILFTFDNTVKGINDTLTAVKEKIAQKDKDGYPELWELLASYQIVLKKHSENTSNTGLELLPESAIQQWEIEFISLETPLMQNLIAHVESSRIMLQIIKRYTPDEINTITQIIATQIPADFTYEEAVEYQNDYFKALVNFKKEFKEEKNLWDKFLDILAGGTHQLPSERVMMERWLNGEKGDL